MFGPDIRRLCPIAIVLTWILKVCKTQPEASKYSPKAYCFTCFGVRVLFFRPFVELRRVRHLSLVQVLQKKPSADDWPDAYELSQLFCLPGPQVC